MKILFLLILLGNAALGLWGYVHALPARPAPPSYHPERLVVWKPSAHTRLPAEVAPARIKKTAARSEKKASPAKPAARPIKVAAHPQESPTHAKPVVRAPVRPPTYCWRFGPFSSHVQAANFLGNRHGVIRVQPGRVRAYRVFLPVSIHWPDAAQLRADGVRGAYVARGPRGARVLSLGVFISLAAAHRYQGTLLHHGLHTQQAPLVSAPRYFVRYVTRLPLSPAQVALHHAACTVPAHLH